MVESEKKEEEEAKRTVALVGKQLSASKTCPNKDTLVKLLKQASNALPQLRQAESLKASVKPLRDSLFRLGLLEQKDKDVRVLVGSCLSEVIRMLAPNPDFSRSVSRDIFKFLLSIFGELDDTASPYFPRKAKLLESIAKLRFCLVMLDTGCEALVLKMFKTFFNVVRDDHPQSLINYMASIITSILEEELKTDPNPIERNTFQSLFDVILQHIIKDGEDVGSASFQLAVSVIKDCGEKLECYINRFLTSCVLNRDAVGSAIKESYHEIILEIFQISPQMLLSVIPNLTNELLTDQVDVRIKALNLMKKLLSLRGQHVVREYPHIFTELLNRFSDKSAEVRLAALSCAKALYMTSLSGVGSFETLSAIQGRLLDHDDKVRVEAVNLVCDITKTDLDFKSSDLVTQAAEGLHDKKVHVKPSDLVTQAAERLRDKKVSVRSKAMKKLLELYHEYCTRCATDITLLNDIIEEIPCKILMLCYEKDCPEFRPQSMELVLADLFPTHLSIEERMKHWVFMFSLFKPPHIKALKAVLFQKRRLRDGLKYYMDLCNRAQANGSREGERDLEALVGKMSSCFPDCAEAQDCFQKLKEVKHNGILRLLQQSLSEGTKIDSEAMKDVCQRELGDQRGLLKFLHQLSRKCSFNIFGAEDVHYIIDCLSSDEASEQHLKNYQVQLLLTIISIFPSLLRGSEKQFQVLLLEGQIPFNEQLTEILAREGRNMSIKLSDIYPFLENICSEGTRAQSKLAVSAIVALADASDQFIFPKLCKVLVGSLRNKSNIQTVLQSIGCMAQHSVPGFEAQEKAITDYIVEEIFHQSNALTSKDLHLSEEVSDCCMSCKLKICGLKALVRTFLPHKQRSLGRPISFLLDIIQQMLQMNGFLAAGTSCGDHSFIRLAAAKSVLQLSRKWDLHISPEIFRSTILAAKDPSPEVRRSFIRKIHKLLSNRILPSRYACAFPFVALDLEKDLRTEAIKYLEDFIQEYGQGAQIHETTIMQGPTNHPVYIMVFLVHVLAHDRNFPAPDCQDENIYAQCLSPLFVSVQTLVNKNAVDANSSVILTASAYLRSIFNAIKKAEDAIDPQMTPKLHLLAEVGISILDSLNTVNMSISHAPVLILLPSSLYTSAASEMREVNAYKADASFVKNLVSQLKREVYRIAGTEIQHCQLLHQNSVRTSGRRQAGSDSKAAQGNNLLTNKTKEQIDDELHAGEREHRDTSNGDTDASGQQNEAISTNPSSVVLHENSSVETAHDRDAENARITLPLSQQKVVASSHRGEAQVNILDVNDHNPSEENLPRKRGPSTRKCSQAAKRTKPCEDSTGTPASDLTDLGGDHIARRTRRQKA